MKKKNNSTRCIKIGETIRDIGIMLFIVILSVYAVAFLFEVLIDPYTSLTPTVNVVLYISLTMMFGSYVFKAAQNHYNDKNH